jgi:hypothetical protein
MRDKKGKVKVLPLGLVFKGYDSVARGYYYYIIQDINLKSSQPYYGHLVTTSRDQVTSHIELPSNILLEKLVLKRSRNKESWVLSSKIRKILLTA